VKASQDESMEPKEPIAAPEPKEIKEPELKKPKLEVRDSHVQSSTRSAWRNMENNKPVVSLFLRGM